MYELLQESFDCGIEWDFRGSVAVKGKGEMRTYVSRQLPKVTSMCSLYSSNNSASHTY